MNIFNFILKSGYVGSGSRIVPKINVCKPGERFSRFLQSCAKIRPIRPIRPIKGMFTVH